MIPTLSLLRVMPLPTTSLHSTKSGGKADDAHMICWGAGARSVGGGVGVTFGL